MNPSQEAFIAKKIEDDIFRLVDETDSEDGKGISCGVFDCLMCMIDDSVSCEKVLISYFNKHYKELTL